MKKILFCLLMITLYNSVGAQKIESIHFNLYTDSLKKGFYNYINVDGKLSDGTWMPLDTTHIRFTSNGGHFKGNDIFIDSSFKEDKVKVKAILKSDPSVWKEVIIYIRRRGFDEPLKTNYQLIEEMNDDSRRRKSEREG